jgi:hypothetical protein
MSFTFLYFQEWCFLLTGRFVQNLYNLWSKIVKTFILQESSLFCALEILLPSRPENIEKAWQQWKLHAGFPGVPLSCKVHPFLTTDPAVVGQLPPVPQHATLHHHTYTHVSLAGDIGRSCVADVVETEEKLLLQKRPQLIVSSLSPNSWSSNNRCNNMNLFGQILV